MNRTSRLMTALSVALLLSGCVAPPARLSIGPFAEMTVVRAQQEQPPGSRVRWGGVIVKVDPRKGETCFEVVQLPLDAQARPSWSDQSDGRFLACAQGFYDPALYEKGREVTVIGSLQGRETGKIGEYDYVYPRLSAEIVYLWPKRDHVAVMYDPWPYDYWYPYGGPWPYPRPWYCP